MTVKRSTASEPPLHVHLDQVRALWLARQGLGEDTARDAAAVVRDAGWLPSAGGQGPYLALRARRSHLARAAVDRAVFLDRALVEALGPRSVAMLVPADDAALALRAARASEDARFSRVKTAAGLDASHRGALGRPHRLRDEDAAPRKHAPRDDAC